MNTVKRALTLCAFVATSVLEAQEVFEPEHWREAARLSSAVVSGVVLEPWIYVIRPEKRSETVVVAPDGTHYFKPPRRDEYVRGGVTRVRVDAVHRSNGRLTIDQVIEVYSPSLEAPNIERDHRYLFFLRSPIDDARIAAAGFGSGWSDLYGTTYYLPLGGAEVSEPFDPIVAYGFAGTSVPPLLEYGSRDSWISEAIRQSANETPSASVAHDVECGPAGCTVSFQAQAADRNGDPLTYTWQGCVVGSGTAVTCGTAQSGEVTGMVTVKDPVGAEAHAMARVAIYPTAFSTGDWNTCVVTAEWSCNAAGEAGCTRAGSRSRTITETAWSPLSEAATVPPPATESCTESTRGYAVSYQSTYDAAWTCTSAGATGCYKNRLSYAADAFRPTAPDADVPPARLYATGYVASYSVSSWSGCSASCGGGTRTRTVTPASWTSVAPGVAAPPTSESCNTHSCELTCYDYPDTYPTQSECRDAGWSICERRFRSNGVGGTLTCYKGFN